MMVNSVQPNMLYNAVTPLMYWPSIQQNHAYPAFPHPGSTYGYPSLGGLYGGHYMSVVHPWHCYSSQVQQGVGGGRVAVDSNDDAAAVMDSVSSTEPK